MSKRNVKLNQTTKTSRRPVSHKLTKDKQKNSTVSPSNTIPNGNGSIQHNDINQNTKHTNQVVNGKSNIIISKDLTEENTDDHTSRNTLIPDSPVSSDELDLEESISSRFVEVGDNEEHEEPSMAFSTGTPVPKHKGTSNASSLIDSNEDKDYEEDFEGFESDFESDEESEESSDEDVEESAYSSSDDEEILSEKSDPPIKKNEEPTIPVKTFIPSINFSIPKFNQEATIKMKSRSEILRSMVELDGISFSLFVQHPASYETYIRTFGHNSGIQISIQTNEDVISESAQTTDIEVSDKWTQKPIHLPIKEDSVPTRQDYLGVGGEGEKHNGYFALHKTGSIRFSQFLFLSSQVILQLLEESTNTGSQYPNLECNSNFGQLGINIGSSIKPLLENRMSSIVVFNQDDPSILVTGHAECHNEDPETPENNDSDGLMNDAALICVWSVNQPSLPQEMLSARSTPIAITFSPGRLSVVVAGLEDGSLSAWDLRKNHFNNSNIQLSGDTNPFTYKIRPPCCSTACSDQSLGGSSIISLQVISKFDNNLSNNESFQIVSLTSDGLLTWWGVIRETGTTQLESLANVSSHLDGVPWWGIGITKSTSLDMKTYVEQLSGKDTYLIGDKLFYDMKLSLQESNRVYVAAGNGMVLHCSRHQRKLHPQFFIPELHPTGEATSISVCPHDPSYLVIGGTDGIVRLYSLQSSDALTRFQAPSDSKPVVHVIWSPSRPCVFYMLDSIGRFHIWDLMSGDIYPFASYEINELMQGQIVMFDVANVMWQNDENIPYAVFTNEMGNIAIRPLSQKFLSRNKTEYENELQRFRCYASII